MRRFYSANDAVPVIENNNIVATYFLIITKICN